MRIKYQASFFADLSALAATPENTLALLTQLSVNGLGLLPSTVHEISPPNMSPVPRLRFVSPNGDAEIFVASGRLDIIKQSPVLGGTELESLDSFRQFVERSASAIFHGRTITGSRLAFVVQAMMGELAPAELTACFSKLFTAPTFYGDHPPNEWTFRANSLSNLSFGNFNEGVNTILKAERVQGKAIASSGEWQDFDRVMMEFDINTLPTNITPRFSSEIFRLFIDAARPIIENLETDLISKLA